MLRAQDERKSQVVEVVVDGRPEAGKHEVVGRHVLQESLQQSHVEEVILPRRSPKYEFAICEPATSPEKRSHSEGRDSAGENRSVSLKAPCRHLPTNPK